MPSIPNQRFKDGILDWQDRFLYDFDNHLTHRFWMKKLHRRCRKTTMALTLLVREAMTHPGKVYVYCSPLYSQSKAIVWNTPDMLDAILPPKQYIKRKNESELYVEFKNKARLVLKGSDNYDSLKGLDATGLVLDEWSLQKHKVWTEVFEPIMSLEPEDKKDRKWCLFIYTPKPNTFCLDMETFALDPENDEWDYEKLGVYDTDIFSQDRIERIKKAGHIAEFQQEYLCTDLFDDDRILITPRLLDDLTKFVPTFHTKRRIVAVDPSSGGDTAVVYYMVNGAVEDELLLKEKDTMVLTGYIQEFCIRNKCNNIIIDNVGVGQGVYDRLRERDIDARTFSSAEKAVDANRFKNKRAEAWYRCMEKMERHEIPAIYDRELIKEITNVGFKIVDSNGKIQIDSKADIKKRLHCSPDRADCFIYGIYGLDYVEEEGIDNVLNEHRRSRRNNFSGTAMSSL